MCWEGATMNDELPERRWKLSAPESVVLLWGPETGDAWTLKVALLELIVRKVLRLVSVKHRRLLIFPTRSNVLIRGPGRIPPASRSLRAVLDAYPTPRIYPDGTVGVPVDRLAREVFARYLRGGSVREGEITWSWPGGGYVQAVVLPALERRGLYARERSERAGGPFRWGPTVEGLDALEELRALVATGRESFGEWAQRDPGRARTYVATAGPALLLLGGLTPSLQRLQQWASGRQDAGVAGKPEPEPDGDALSLDALAGTSDPNAADGLDATFSTLSEDVDRAWQLLHGGGDGGGDGGGGGE
jgi:hypothetical protein